MVKNFHFAIISTVWELAYDKLYIFCWRIYHTVRDFNFSVKKNLSPYQCCVSGIRCFFTPWIRDPGWSNRRIRIRDKQTKFVNSLYTKIGRIRDPVFFYPPDLGSGSGMEQWPDPG
jgi:hypothetical protein